MRKATIVLSIFIITALMAAWTPDAMARNNFPGQVAGFCNEGDDPVQGNCDYCHSQGYNGCPGSNCSPEQNAFLAGDLCFFCPTNSKCQPSGCIDADCDDGVFCNGVEACGSNGNCQAGMNPCAAGEQCNETQGCFTPPDCVVDGDCDDGAFCNGAEACAAGRCVAGASPCASGETCNEVDGCVPAPQCRTNADCSDGIFCNGVETCNGGACANGQSPCAAGEACDELNGCLAPPPPVTGSGAPADHTDEEEGVLHRPGKDDPFNNGCTACHGTELTGAASGGFAPSCFSCHGQEWDGDHESRYEGKKRRGDRDDDEREYRRSSSRDRSGDEETRTIRRDRDDDDDDD